MAAAQLQQIVELDDDCFKAKTQQHWHKKKTLAVNGRRQNMTTKKMTKSSRFIAAAAAADRTCTETHVSMSDGSNVTKFEIGDDSSNPHFSHELLLFVHSKISLLDNHSSLVDPS